MTNFATLRKLLFILILVQNLQLVAQQGGRGVYMVLKQPVNARQAAWGGYNNAYRTGDANLFLANPALIGPENHNRLSLNLNSQFRGIWSGNAAYAGTYRNSGYWAAGVSYIDYGKMDAYDAGGNAEGQTNANETTLAAAFSSELRERLFIGAGMKLTYSILGPFVSNGLSFDLGASWYKKDSSLMAGLVVKNLGFMVIPYGDGPREPMPFQIETGISFKPKHMPFRFGITYHNLQKFDLTYNQYLEGTTIDLSGQTTSPESAGFGTKLVRHFAAGTELVLGRNFGIMVGYNHQRRTEMGPETRKGAAGFSWGLNFRISKINISYASACYFPGFNMNLFTFSTRLSEFRKK